jgi:hypothetical protein
MQKLIILALLLACGTAHAADWVSTGKTDDGQMENFTDVSSIRVAGAIRRAWVKTVYGAHVRKGEGQEANKWYGYAVSRVSFDCNEENYRSEAVSVYFTDGTNSSDSPAGFPTAWAPVPPDTALSAIMQFICAWKPK